MRDLDGSAFSFAEALAYFRSYKYNKESEIG